MAWDHLQRQRIVRRYRLIVRGAAPIFVGGLLLLVGGAVLAITHSEFVPVVLGAVLVAASSFNLYRALVNTVKVVEIEEAERRGQSAG
jgi:general stress protein CsbA